MKLTTEELAILFDTKGARISESVLDAFTQIVKTIISKRKPNAPEKDNNN